MTVRVPSPGDLVEVVHVTAGDLDCARRVANWCVVVGALAGWALPARGGAVAWPQGAPS